MKKRLLTLFVLVLALALVPCAALAAGEAETIASGTCGDNASWTIDANGVLKISGSGEITCVPIPAGLSADIDKARDYLEIFDRKAVVWGPWCENYGDVVTEIRIGCGITKISTGAFMNLQKVERILISDSVSEIGNFVFGYDLALKEIYLPASLRSLGVLVFGGCEDIEKAYFPSEAQWQQVTQVSAGKIVTAQVEKRHPEYVHELTNDNMTAHLVFSAETPGVHGDIVWVEGVPATCTENGTLGHFVCHDCGGLFYSAEDKISLDEQELVLPKLGHSLTGEIFHSDKLHWGTCEHCNETVYFVHHWDAGEVIQPATPEQEGIRHYTCTVCGEEKTEAMNRTSYAARAYEVILERIGDEEGIAHWDSEMANGASAGVIINEFLRSDEFKSKGKTNEEIVTIVYNAMLSRDPDPEGLANWTALLDAGYSTTKLVSEFVASEEFGHLCDDYRLTAGEIPLGPRDQNGNIARFVDRCYTLALGRPSDEAGLNEWCAHLINGDLNEFGEPYTPERVAFGFVFSPEAKALERSDEAFITMLYRLMLDRKPDAAGLANWVSALRQNTAAEIAYDAAFETGRSEADAIDQTRQNIYALFAASEEFALMCRNFGF